MFPTAAPSTMMSPKKLRHRGGGWYLYRATMWKKKSSWVEDSEATGWVAFFAGAAIDWRSRRRRSSRTCRPRARPLPLSPGRLAALDHSAPSSSPQRWGRPTTARRHGLLDRSPCHREGVTATQVTVDPPAAWRASRPPAASRGPRPGQAASGSFYAL